MSCLHLGMRTLSSLAWSVSGLRNIFGLACVTLNVWIASSGVTAIKSNSHTLMQACQVCWSVITVLMKCVTCSSHVWIDLNWKVKFFLLLSVHLLERHQGCVAMLTGTSAGLWDVLNRDSKQKYICKKMAEGITTTQVPPTTQPLSCPIGWIKKDPGSCVQVNVNKYTPSWNGDM